MLVYCERGARVESPVALVCFLLTTWSWYVFTKDIKGVMYI